MAAAQATGEKLSGYSLVIAEKAGVDGRLFGSVTSMDVAAALAKAGFESINKMQIHLPEGALKSVGEYPITVALHPDVVVDVNVVVQGEMA